MNSIKIVILEITSWKFFHTDFPNQCYVNGKGYAVGKHTPIGICKEIECSSDFSFEEHT